MGRLLEDDSFYFKSLYFIGCGFGLLMHFDAYANQLVEADGIFNEIYRKSDLWEVAQGRWMMVLFDTISHHLVLHSFLQIESIFLMAIAAVLIVKIFDTKNKWAGYILVAIFMSSPQFAELLTFSFAALNYSIAMVLAVLSVYLLEKYNGIVDFILAAFCIAITLGTYQAYLAIVTFLVVSVNLIELLYNYHVDVKELLFKFGRSVLCCTVGLVIYFLVTFILFKMFNITWADYRDMDKIGNISILDWLIRLKNSFKLPYEVYFTNANMNVEWWNWKWLFAIVFIFGFVCILYNMIKSSQVCGQKKARAIFEIFLMMIAAPAYSVVCFMTEMGNDILMIPQIMLPFCAIISILDRIQRGKGDFIQNKYFIVKLSAIFIGTVITYQMALLNAAYYKALYLTWDKTKSVGQEIVSRLYQIDEFEQCVTPVYILGNCIHNDRFSDVEKELYEAVKGSHADATIMHYPDPIGGQASWRYLLENHFGCSIPSTDPAVVRDISNLQEFKDMEDFPQKGSVKQIDGAIVIRLSDIVFE